MLKQLFLPRLLLRLALMLIILPTHSFARQDDAAIVNVYSYRQSFLVKPIFEKFTAQTGIKVKFITAKKGLIERIVSEGKNGKADLLLTSNFDRLQDAVNAKITAKVDDAEINNPIPHHLRDPKGHYFALTSRVRLLYVSKDRVAEGAIKNYQDLAEPKWRGKICTRSGTHDYNLTLFASFIENWGAGATEAWLRAVKQNLARKPQGNDRAQVKAIKEGLCDIAIGNSYYYGLMQDNPAQRSWAEAVRLIYPNQATGGAHVNISGMALMKNAPHSDNALKLMRFLLSKEIQEFYSKNNHEYSVRDDIPNPEIFAEWGDFKTDKTRFAKIYKRRREAFELVTKTKFNH